VASARIRQQAQRLAWRAAGWRAVEEIELLERGGDFIQRQAGRGADFVGRKTVADYHVLEPIAQVSLVGWAAEVGQPLAELGAQPGGHQAKGHQHCQQG
jgi:hypothetical protein